MCGVKGSGSSKSVWATSLIQILKFPGEMRRDENNRITVLLVIVCDDEVEWNRTIGYFGSVCDGVKKPCGS